MSTFARVRTDSLERINRERYHERAREVKRIYDELCAANRPLSVKELMAGAYLSKKCLHRRLDDLIVNGDVRRREDGPDSRVSYYEPIDSVHHCNGEWWEPKPVRLEGNNGN